MDLFLVVDKAGAWGVRVPAVARESAGVTWSRGETPGRMVPIGDFYVTHAGTDTAATMNAALASGKNLLVTPGIYELEAPLQVRRKDTVVLGMGYATLKPVKGTAAMETADVDGIELEHGVCGGSGGSGNGVDEAGMDDSREGAGDAGAPVPGGG